MICLTFNWFLSLLLYRESDGTNQNSRNWFYFTCSINYSRVYNASKKFGSRQYIVVSTKNLSASEWLTFFALYVHFVDNRIQFKKIEPKSPCQQPLGYENNESDLTHFCFLCSPFRQHNIFESCKSEAGLKAGSSVAYCESCFLRENCKINESYKKTDDRNELDEPRRDWSIMFLLE